PWEVIKFFVPENDFGKKYILLIYLIIAGLRSKNINLPIWDTPCYCKIEKPFLIANGDRIDGLENILNFILSHDRR
ncbi:MAG: hypothetical protein Q8P49_02115, partial [Candidatus Liptonbacteria bacterium]|nr:hypothetical protein [Candidatus Liptonbacteria bacterium]